MNFFANHRNAVGQASDRAVRSRRCRKVSLQALVERLEPRELLAASTITIGSLGDVAFVGSTSNNNVTVSFNFGTSTYTINDTVDVINVTGGGPVVVTGN